MNIHECWEEHWKGKRIFHLEPEDLSWSHVLNIFQLSDPVPVT